MPRLSQKQVDKWTIGKIQKSSDIDHDQLVKEILPAPKRPKRTRRPQKYPFGVFIKRIVSIMVKKAVRTSEDKNDNNNMATSLITMAADDAVGIVEDNSIFDDDYIKEEVKDSDSVISESEIKEVEFSNADYHKVYFDDGSDSPMCDDQSAAKTVTIVVNEDNEFEWDDENLQRIIGKFFPILQIESSNKFLLKNYYILDSKQSAEVTFIKRQLDNDDDDKWLKKFNIVKDCVVKLDNISKTLDDDSNAAGPSGINRQNEESDDQMTESDSENEVEEKKPKRKRSKNSGGPVSKKLRLKRERQNQRKTVERNGWGPNAFQCKRCTMPGYPGYLLFRGKDTLGRHVKRAHKGKLHYDDMETIPWNKTRGWRYAYLKKFRVSEGFRPEI